MEVWKIIFLSNWVICRFHVNLPGCSLSHEKTADFSTDFAKVKKTFQVSGEQKTTGFWCFFFGGDEVLASFTLASTPS